MFGYTYSLLDEEFSILSDVDAVIASGFESLAKLTTKAKLDNKNIELANNIKLQAAVTSYENQDFEQFEHIKTKQTGTVLQKIVWQHLKDIAVSDTTSYQSLAASVEKPKAHRAVASACGKNLNCVFVPCHRVLRSSGELGGYYYGLRIKQLLLDHESQDKV